MSYDVRKHILPASWYCDGMDATGGAYYRVHPLMGKRDLTVISSWQVERDGNAWQHISVSRPDRLPAWDDLKTVKDIFAGKDAVAYQILPPEAEYYNVHPYCLHMWVPLGHRPLPDFRQEVGGVMHL